MRAARSRAETETEATRSSAADQLATAAEREEESEVVVVMEGWRKKVVFRARRAWAAVSGRLRARKQGSGGLLKLHEDVQTCDYKDVQVMFEMLTWELEASQHARKQQQLPPSPSAMSAKQ
ncbi:hypothetical protein E2562_027463 [Oryza meyeriana var. granulata]|uniref:Uncharacterized protein n=1 Tax=Oryza meyeriana var. granulata TaxID=110450 RepID=A0A6G1CJD7_9ORYZ|nr:hypothetical protein E2562_027463 [Oryza meyeriana var. granulata]